LNTLKSTPRSRDVGITTKEAFRAAWLAGTLGNRPRVWASEAAIIADGYTGELSIRVHASSSQHSRYRVPVTRLVEVATELRQAGARDLWFNESAPDDCLLIQGEYYHGGSINARVLNRYLHYSTESVKMKEAFAYGKQTFHSEGLATDVVLSTLMSPRAWDDFQLLRERYEEHTIEFSVYGREVGVLPFNNTLIWEVRNY
jgi:hypothetical protein